MVNKQNAIFPILLLGILFSLIFFLPNDSLLGSQVPETTDSQTHDYLFTNIRIVDGSGNPSYVGDVAVKDGYISGVGDLTGQTATKTIDGTGKVITPGFIDIHTHSEDYWRNSPNGAPALMQGITSQIGGNCGTSVADVGAYLQNRQQEGIAINYGMFTGYKELRRQAQVSGTATAAQIKKMAQLLKESIENGSLGLSVGLSYYPQNQATTAELIQLAHTVKGKNALFAMHIRSEENNVLSSVDEIIQIASKTGVRMQYGHVKTAQTQNWSKMPQVLLKLDKAVAANIDIKGDIYGYTYSSNDKGTKESIKAENVVLGLKNPNIMIGSDTGLYVGGQAEYPRAYANYARILAKYVRNDKVLTLETAVAKMTSQPAARLGLSNRGSIAVGKCADLNVFDLNNIQPMATRDNPMALAKGMDYVMVNGLFAIAEGKLTGEKNGKTLTMVHQ